MRKWLPIVALLVIAVVAFAAAPYATKTAALNKGVALDAKKAPAHVARSWAYHTGATTATRSLLDT